MIWEVFCFCLFICLFLCLFITTFLIKEWTECSDLVSGQLDHRVFNSALFLLLLLSESQELHSAVQHAQLLDSVCRIFWIYKTSMAHKLPQKTSCIEVCFYQCMSYTSKLNNGLIYPLQPYSWSFAESVIYKEAGYNLFLLTCISPGYLIYLHRKSPHFLNSSCKLKVGKNCILIISQGVSHLCSFFFSFFLFFLLMLLFLLVFMGLWSSKARNIFIYFVNYELYPHMKIFTNRLSVTLQYLCMWVLFYLGTHIAFEQEIKLDSNPTWQYFINME